LPDGSWSEDDLIFGAVRNPWEWYVSYFFSKVQKGKLIRTKLNHPTPFRSFAQFMHFIFFETDHPIRFPANRDASFDFTAMRRDGVGMLTEYHRQMFYYNGAYLPQRICRLESVREDLKQVARALGLDIDHRIDIHPVERKSPLGHGPYQEYYTPELRQLVAEREREFIERYNYDFSDHVLTER
jgi:hypothetical protein